MVTFAIGFVVGVILALAVEHYGVSTSAVRVKGKFKALRSKL